MDTSPTIECSGNGPIEPRLFGGRRERAPGSGIGERGELLGVARTELGGDGSPRGV